jgi:hypothetical protein
MFQGRAFPQNVAFLSLLKLISRSASDPTMIKTINMNHHPKNQNTNLMDRANKSPTLQVTRSSHFSFSPSLLLAYFWRIFGVFLAYFYKYVRQQNQTQKSIPNL